ncbi:MAG: PTS sugar transporter subunit IIB [Chloroflexi bacterium]|nr:PTS sugar transporter subunit IIB [Chloroflexota bacterium]
MKKPKIMIVCGFGLGSSMVLRLTLDSVLKAEGIQAETFCSDEASSKGEKFDIVFTSQAMSKLFKDMDKPMVVITNFLSKDEVREKGLDLIKGLITE